MKTKYVFKLGFLSALMFLLAACGGGESASTPQPTSPDTSADTSSTTADKSGFTSTITGGVEAELNGPGYFMCDIDEVTIGANGRLSNNILILLPRDATAGTTYAIVSEIMGADQASASYVGATIETDYYDHDVTGSVTLDAVPSQEGERVAGSFNFSASNRGGAEANITGSFDFVAGNNSFFNCTGE